MFTVLAILKLCYKEDFETAISHHIIADGHVIVLFWGRRQQSESGHGKRSEVVVATRVHVRLRFAYLIA